MTAIQQYIRSYGIGGSVAGQVQNSSLSATYVKVLSGNGVFFADEFLLAKDKSRFSSIELPLERTLCLGCRKEQSSACDAVEKMIIEYGESLFEVE